MSNHWSKKQFFSQNFFFHCQNSQYSGCDIIGVNGQTIKPLIMPISMIMFNLVHIFRKSNNQWALLSQEAKFMLVNYGFNINKPTLYVN